MKSARCRNCQKTLPTPCSVYCSRKCQYDWISSATIKSHHRLATAATKIWPILNRREQSVLRYRQRGWALSRVAKKVGMTKQGVAYIEHRLKKLLTRYTKDGSLPPRPAQRV